MAPTSATFFSRAWYGDEEITLPLPEEWQVETLAPPQLPALTPAEIGSAFQRPIGSLPISQLARGSSSVAIVVDDLSRPTPAAVIIPALLEELIAAGVPRAGIRFVVGGGSHRPLSRDEIDFPAIRAMHEASSLVETDDVAAWRASGRPAAAPENVFATRLRMSPLWFS